ncbi:hypothetical protein EDC01DRAFT_632688 [Geopyxis carbonaria]|nr:hypothetical protein EDC01DRAFT_632688 [Geopyxis carbonaria]
MTDVDTHMTDADTMNDAPEADLSPSTRVTKSGFRFKSVVATHFTTKPQATSTSTQPRAPAPPAAAPAPARSPVRAPAAAPAPETSPRSRKPPTTSTTSTNPTNPADDPALKQTKTGFTYRSVAAQFAGPSLAATKPVVRRRADREAVRPKDVEEFRLGLAPTMRREEEMRRAERERRFGGVEVEGKGKRQRDEMGEEGDEGGKRRRRGYRGYRGIKPRRQRGY